MAPGGGTASCGSAIAATLAGAEKEVARTDAVVGRRERRVPERTRSSEGGPCPPMRVDCFSAQFQAAPISGAPIPRGMTRQRLACEGRIVYNVQRYISRLSAGVATMPIPPARARPAGEPWRLDAHRTERCIELAPLPSPPRGGGGSRKGSWLASLCC